MRTHQHMPMSQLVACDAAWAACTQAFRSGAVVVTVSRTAKINPGVASGGPLGGGIP